MAKVSVGGASMLTRKLLEQCINDYHWMLRVVVENTSDMHAEVKTVVYGIDAAMPRVVGISDPIANEVARKERHYKKIQDYKSKILIVQERINKVTEPREEQILYWLLEGKSARWIASQMNLSHPTIKNIKDDIILQMLSQTKTGGS